MLTFAADCCTGSLEYFSDFIYYYIQNSISFNSKRMFTLFPDETFKIHRNPKKRHRVINDTIVEESISEKKSTTNESVIKKPKKARFNFINDECDVSGGSSDEMDESSDTELNSIICNEEVHDDTSVDMRAIYLQSVK